MNEDMQVTEYMQEICNNMRVLLLSTIAGQSVRAIGYDADREEVKILYLGGRLQRINVAGDSGIELIKDVLKYANL